jgi:pectate lyase
LGVHVKQTNASTYLVGIRKGQGATVAGGGTDLYYTGNHFPVGAVVFVVARYAFNAGAGDDTVTLWVNPPTNSFGGVEPTPNIAATDTGNPTDAAQLQHAFVRCNSSTTSGVNEVDDLRVGSSWAEVTPPGGGLPPSPTPNLQPVITQALLAGSELILRGTNGVTNGVYQILSATQSSLPVTNWVSLSTNLFNASGNFACTNPVSPAEGQRFYRLLVGGQIAPPPTPPVITSQPDDLTVFVGQPAQFEVTATGSPPLSYQWFFNTNTPIANATSATHFINPVTTNDAGTYSVVISNSLGSVTSILATLTVNPPVTNPPVGFAAYGYDLTGGQGGAVLVATNEASLAFALGSATPRVVHLLGAITLAGNVACRNNKTLIGVGTNATIIGNLNISRATNVIVSNLHFTNPSGVGDADGVTVEYSEHVWIDHCTFYDCSDGSLDITHGSDLVTVSWCKFYYTVNTGHNFVTLVGHSDSNAGEDSGRLRVTLHHNWWSTLCAERMPRVRFGQVHVFNNYANTPGNNYCVRASIGSEVLVENNYYENLDSPYEYFAPNGLIKATGNTTVNCTGVQAFSDAVFVPPYSYTLETPAAAKPNVMAGAGAGAGPFP